MAAEVSAGTSGGAGGHANTGRCAATRPSTGSTTVDCMSVGIRRRQPAHHAFGDPDVTSVTSEETTDRRVDAGTYDRLSGGVVQQLRRCTRCEREEGPGDVVRVESSRQLAFGLSAPDETGDVAADAFVTLGYHPADRLVERGTFGEGRSLQGRLAPGLVERQYSQH